jgi:hypothetical protein
MSQRHAIALALTLVLGLILAACGGGTAATTTSQIETTTTEETTTTVAAPGEAVPLDGIGEFEELEPGTRYVTDPDGDPGTPLTVEFAIDDPGWLSLLGAVKQVAAGTPEGGYAAVKFVTIDRVASAACDDTRWIEVGDTAEEWATGLADIEDFIIVEPLTEVSAFGYDGYHLTLEVSDDFGTCVDTLHEDSWDGWEGPTLSRYYQGAGQVVEFWALDVEGSPLLIEATWLDVPEHYLSELAQIIESITIRP